MTREMAQQSRRSRMSHESLQSLLSKELENLKDVTQFGQDLEVVWSASRLSKLSGEVKGNIIYVYETESAQALDTLRHEFIDYLVSGAIKPYQKATALYSAMINTLIEKLVDDAYLEKEKVVGRLVKILARTQHQKRTTYNL